MKVQVKVATILMKKADPPIEHREFSIDLENGADVITLIEALGVPPALVGSVTVNKKRTARDAVLSEGDVVAVIPSISGG